MKKRVLCILLCALILLTTSLTYTFAETVEQGITKSALLAPISEKTMMVQQYVGLTVNGSPLKSDVQPFINGDDRTVLPLRAIAEAFGATVNWDDATQTAAITLGNRSLKVKIGERSVVANGQAIAMDTSAFVKDGRTFVPARAIAEGLGLTINWDPNTGTVTITIALTPPVTPPAPQVQFPLTASERNDNMGGSAYQHMETNVTLYENGTLTGTTHTWTTARGSSLTGGVVVRVLNKDNTVIWQTQQDHQYSVLGPLPDRGGRRSDRTDTWTEQVPPEIMKNAVKLSISQSPVAPPAPQVKFPLTASEQNDKIEGDGGQHMKTDLTLSETGTLTGKTRTWTTNRSYGFTGGVVAAVVNKDDIVIWQTQQDHQYGVDGTWVPFKDSDRTETWSEQVPSEIMKNAAKIVVHNQHQGKNRLSDIGNTILRNNPAAKVSEWITSLINGG